MVTEGDVPLPRSITLPDDQAAISIPEQEGEGVPLNPPAEMSIQEGIPAQPDSLMTALPGEQIVRPDQGRVDNPDNSLVAGEGVVPSLQPVSDFPSVEDIKKSDIDQPVEGSPAFVQSTQPEMTLAETPTSGLLEQPSSIVDMTPDAVATVPEPVSDASSVVQATAPVPATDSTVQDLQQAQSRISELEGIVAGGEEIQAQSSQQIADMKARISSLEAELARAQERLVPVSPIASSEPKSRVDTGVKTQVKKGIVDSPVKLIEVPKWVLKSARSGQAVLGRIGNSDLKTISVGERIDGLGTILSIDRGQNGWVVVGTLDRVTE
jgi:hypothetical protein